MFIDFATWCPKAVVAVLAVYCCLALEILRLICLAQNSQLKVKCFVMCRARVPIMKLC
jgi:hypothetical protein